MGVLANVIHKWVNYDVLTLEVSQERSYITRSHKDPFGRGLLSERRRLSWINCAHNILLLFHERKEWKSAYRVE